MKKTIIKRMLKSLIPDVVIKRLRTMNVEDTTMPQIYNRNGEIMKLCYLSNDATSHTPFSLISGRIPERILWDRNNNRLPTHFYVDSNIFHVHNNANIKIAMLVESKTIIPEIYEKLYKNPDIIKSFDYFFTHDNYLLQTIPNARFIPASGVWYGTKHHGGEMVDCYSKSKNISMVASNKSACQMHIFRNNIAHSLFLKKLVDVMGKAINGVYVSISDYLYAYRYNIVIENEISEKYFTEKILNCFASKTIPIYFGAKEIGNYFNPNGIVFIEEATEKSVIKAIKCCTERYYVEHIDAIEDNYKRVKKYICIEDYIAEEYKDIFNTF